MAAVAGQATTFNLDNLVGELFHLTPNRTPFLSTIGGLTGGMGINTIDIPWQTEDNAAVDNPSNLEGDDPTYAEVDRQNVSNTTQIFQEGVEVSYTKQAATGQVASTTVLGNQPVGDEFSHQLGLKIAKVGRQVENAFINGVYARPADNVTARKTAGISSVITSNTVAAGAADLSKDMIDDVMRQLAGDADSGAPMENLYVFAPALQKQRFSNIYGYAPESRNVGGVNVVQVETDFALVNIVFNPFVAADEVLFVDVAQCAPCFLPIPGKGHFFAEQLAQTGAAWKGQVYGEIGLKYGPESWHAKIDGLSTS